MAILVIGATMWAGLSEEFKLSVQNYEIRTIPDEDYQKMWSEIIKVGGTAPKEDDKSKGKKQKKEGSED